MSDAVLILMSNAGNTSTYVFNRLAIGFLPFDDESSILCISFLKNSTRATEGIYRNDKHPPDKWRLRNKQGEADDTCRVVVVMMIDTMQGDADDEDGDADDEPIQSNSPSMHFVVKTFHQLTSSLKRLI